jgi:glycosyltransferase involved in cell wall biosynthesis
MIYILLATYNGARFLPRLLDSVRAQSAVEWRLLVRDDDSSDETPRIVERAAAADSRILILRDGRLRQGAARNFGILMEAGLARGADYLCFADQDDVWLPNKLQLQLQAIQEMEARLGGEHPCLAHTDLRVVDERLRVLRDSFVRSMAIDVRDEGLLPRLLLYNRATGCATMINRSLAWIAAPIPEEAVLHDWWLALVAASCGGIRFLDVPTVLYRQHRENQVGALSTWRKLNPLGEGWRNRIAATTDALPRAIRQAAALGARLRRIDGDAARASLAVVERFCATFESRTSCWRRFRELRRLGTARVGLARQSLLMARLLLHQHRERLSDASNPAWQCQHRQRAA